MGCRAVVVFPTGDTVLAKGALAGTPVFFDLDAALKNGADIVKVVPFGASNSLLVIISDSTAGA